MAKAEVTQVDERVSLAEDISVGVNVPLKAHLGVAMVAWACHACGLFLGLEHNVKGQPVCTGVPGEDGKPEHDPIPADRYDFESVSRTEKRDGRLYLLSGTKIPDPDDPAELQKQIDALTARLKAAEEAAAKKG